MPKEKTLEEKLEEASSAVERALEARDKAIQDLMEAKMAFLRKGHPFANDFSARLVVFHVRDSLGCLIP